MTITNGYCTEAELREQLGDTGSTLSATQIHRAINATSRGIDLWCGRWFWQDSTPVARLYLPDDPYTAWVDDISTTTGLVVETDEVGDGTYSTTWAASDYQLEPLVRPTSDWPWWRIVAVGTRTFPTRRRRASLRITSRGGWATRPDDVTEACLIRASALYKRKEAPFGVLGSSELGVVRISRRRDPDVVELLDPYVRLDVVGV